MHRAVICRRLHTTTPVGVRDSLRVGASQRRKCWLQGPSLALIEVLSPIGRAERLDPQNIDSLQAAHTRSSHAMRCAFIRATCL
jgi:hypothetical protein